MYPNERQLLGASPAGFATAGMVVLIAFRVGLLPTIEGKFGGNPMWGALSLTLFTIAAALFGLLYTSGES